MTSTDIQRQRRHSKLAQVAYWKEQGSCMDCGGSFPAVAMDYDHIRGEKFKTVSILAQHMYSMVRIQEEIAKCDLVCANCHRVRTAARSTHARKGA